MPQRERLICLFPEHNLASKHLKMKISTSYVALLVCLVGSFFTGRYLFQKSCCQPNRPALASNVSSEPHCFPGYLNTSIPIYYINSDRSVRRRENMLRHFGVCNNSLRRMPALNIHDHDAVQEVMDLNGLSIDLYCQKCNATGLGSFSLLVSNMLALSDAYNLGEEYIIIMEDVMTSAFVPYWRWNLEEIVERANREHPDWDMMQLSVTFDAVHKRWYNAWKLNVDSPFVPRALLPRDVHAVSSGALLWSRKGMGNILKRVMYTSPSGDMKVDFLPEKKRASNPKLRCNPDGFYYRLDPPFTSLLVLPSLFAPMLNTGTLVRSKNDTGDLIENDRYKKHYYSFMENLRSNVEAYSAARAEMELGVNATSAFLPYLRLTDKVILTAASTYSKNFKNFGRF